jgi:acyl-CoA thioesterase FadM
MQRLPAEVRSGIVGEVTAVCVENAKTGGMTSRPIPTAVRAKLEQAPAFA